MLLLCRYLPPPMLTTQKLKCSFPLSSIKYLRNHAMCKNTAFKAIFLRLASLGGGPQAHVHMEGMKYRVL